MANQPPPHQVLLELPTGEWRLEEVLAVKPLSLTCRYRGPGHALAPGRTLYNVRVFAEGTCVLTCGAKVASSESTEVVGEHKITFDLVVAAAAGDDEERHGASLTQAVSALVAARSKVLVTLDGVAMPQRGVVAGVHGEPKGLLLEVPGPVRPSRPHATCELTADLFGKRVILSTKLRSQGSGRRGMAELVVEWPTIMRTSRRRATARVKSTPAPLRVQTRLPFSEHVGQFPVADLSVRGFAFEASADETIAVGMVLPTLDLRLPGGHVRGRGVVRNVRQVGGKVAVGVALHDLSPASERALTEFVDAHTSPGVRAARVSDVPQLWALFKGAQLFAPEASARTMRQMESVRTALLTRGQSALVQLVAGAGEEIHGSVELLRIGERTWRLQGLAVRPGSSTSAEALVSAMVQVALRRIDCGYIHVLHPFAGEPQSLQELASTHQLALRPWAWVSGIPGPLQGGEECAEGGPDDRMWVLQKLGQIFSPLESAALNLTPRQLLLPEVGRIYRVAGLECGRQVRLANSVSETLGFALLEGGLPGPLPDGSTLCRLFAASPLARIRQTALAALVRDAHDALRARGGTPAFLLAPRDADLLAGGTLTPRGTCIEAVVERSLFGEVPRLCAQIMTAAPTPGATFTA